MSHQNIQMNSATALVPARLATSRLLPERALQANSRKPQNSPASSLPQAPLQRGTISNFCSPCGRLLAGYLSRANAAQSPRKKRSFRLFPEIRDEPFFWGACKRAVSNEKVGRLRRLFSAKKQTKKSRVRGTRPRGWALSCPGGISYERRLGPFQIQRLRRWRTPRQCHVAVRQETFAQVVEGRYS
jgi:hypothetical protein